jgi:DnaJ family protein B protein 4
MTDYYGLLEVPTTATEKEIKQSYRRLSLINHPDKNPSPDAHEKFKKISEAYETLGDPEKRSRYDMMQQMGGGGGGFPPGFPGFPGGGGGFPGFPGGGGFPFPGFQFGGIRMHHGGGGGGGGGMPPDINSIFENLFNMQQGEHPNIRVFHNGMPMSVPPQKPPPIVNHVSITLEQAYSGFMINLELGRRVFVSGMEQTEIDTIPIQINKGINHGERVVLSEMGNVSPQNIKGDIHIIVDIEKHDLFTRKGLDLCCKKTISLKEALCGFSIEIPHLNGKMLRLTNQNQALYIVKPGYTKEIPNYGMETPTEMGKLILEFDVEFPISLTDEQVTALKSIL